MTQEELDKHIEQKWANYAKGLTMSVAFRKDKNYTANYVKDAFESGFYEFQQILYRNNIEIEKLKLE